MDGVNINRAACEVENQDVLSAVRESALLADVSISVWGGTRTDPHLLNELKNTHGAVGDVGRVIKNLLAGADGPLRATRGAYMAVRTKHYQLTLPWVNDPHASRQEGPRLLSKLIVDRYMTEMSALKRAAIAARDEFLDQYPDLVNQARSNLGTMAPSGGHGYPTVDELRGSFRVYFDFEPLPEGAAFRGLDPFVLDRLTRGLAAKQQRQTAAAAAAVWERVAVPLRHLIRRLDAPVDPGASARFKDASIENIKELVTFLPGWNLTGDAKVTEITDDLRRLLDGVDAKQLRRNPALREDVASKARGVSDKLASWGL